MLLFSASISAQTIFSEDFEGTSGTGLPTGWTQTTLSTDGGWLAGTGTALSSSSFGIADHTKIVATNDDGCNCNKSNDFLMSPSFSLVGYTNVYVSFDAYYFHGTYQGNTEIGTLKVSTNGGTNWTDVQILTGNTNGTWQARYINLSTYAGNPDVKLGFVYDDGQGWLFGFGLDNVNVFVPPAADIEVTGVTPVAGTPASYGTVATNVTIGLSVFNHSGAAVTSFDGSYTVDGNTVNQTFTGNVAPFASGTFNFSTPYSISTVADHPVAVHADITGDANTSDNDGSTIIGGASFIPNHIVTIEEGTGTWCGWCPRGAVFMDSMSHVNPSTTALIAVHNADPMTVTNYDAGIGTMIGGYPSIVVDRKGEYDPSDIFTAYDDHINDFGFANLTATQTYNHTSRVSSVNVSAHFAVNSTDDLRLTCVYIEDGCHGTTTSWDQHNYYTGNAAGAMEGAGHNWAAEPNPVLAANMYFDHVARTILGGFNGQSGSLPATIVAGNTYTYSFTYTIPATSSDFNMHVIVLLINATTGQVLNATAPQTVSGTIDLASHIDQLSLYPSPATDVLNIVFGLNKTQDVSFEITDVLGKVISVVNYNKLAATNQKIEISVADLATGVYFINVKTESGIISRKFIKE